MEFKAKVIFSKSVQEDNYENGCGTKCWLTNTETLYLDYKDVDSLKLAMAGWLNEQYGISIESSLSHIDNEMETFTFTRNEDSNGEYMEITESNPDGYLCDYTFYVNEVYFPVKYDFKGV